MVTYQHNYLHRDISIGNVFAVMKERKVSQQKNAFKIHNVFRDVAGLTRPEDCASDNSEETQRRKAWDNLGIKLDYEEEWKNATGQDVTELTHLAERLENFVHTKIGDTPCAGFVADCDMAKDWNKLFENWTTYESRGEKSVSDCWFPQTKTTYSGTGHGTIHVV